MAVNGQCFMPPIPNCRIRLAYWDKFGSSDIPSEETKE